MKNLLKRVSPYLVLFTLLFSYCYYTTITPGTTYKGPIESDNKKVEVLKQHVKALTLAEHNTQVYSILNKNKEYIIDIINKKGHKAILHSYEVDGVKVSNIEVVIPGKTLETVVIGAHYDSAQSTVGANDNASGVAVLLELLDGFIEPYYTLRIVFFVNEEPPYFKTQKMGSYVYAKKLFERQDNIIGMYSFDMLGSFYEEIGTQHYPPPFSFFYPNKANFIGFVSNVSSKSLMHRSIAKFRTSGARIGSEGIAAPSLVRGVDYSDNWSFYQFNYPAVMITDTSYNRYKHYHKSSDTIDKLNFTAMNEVYNGLAIMFSKLYVSAPMKK